ncbi:MAG: hypothetical protein JNM83_02645 [Myxococcales bacterium]|nr:hypothetical protein [Myxococcales bacterium]
MTPAEITAIISASTSVGTISLKIVDEKLVHPLKILNAWLTGKRLLIVGPSGAGKTRFLNYIKHGQLSPAGPHDKTYKPESTSSRQVEFGRNYKFKIKATMDSIGQDSPADQAERVRRENPNELIIVMNSGSNGDDECIAWVTAFLTVINKLISNPNNLSRLENIMILLNKIDQYPVDVVKAKYDNLVALPNKILTSLSEPQRNSIAVQLTVLVETEGFGEKLAHAALKLMAYRSQNARGVPLRTR